MADPNVRPSLARGRPKPKQAKPAQMGFLGETGQYKPLVPGAKAQTKPAPKRTGPPLDRARQGVLSRAKAKGLNPSRAQVNRTLARNQRGRPPQPKGRIQLFAKAANPSLEPAPQFKPIEGGLSRTAVPRSPAPTRVAPSRGTPGRVKAGLGPSAARSRVNSQPPARPGGLLGAAGDIVGHAGDVLRAIGGGVGASPNVRLLTKRAVGPMPAQKRTMPKRKVY